MVHQHLLVVMTWKRRAGIGMMMVTIKDLRATMEWCLMSHLITAENVVENEAGVATEMQIRGSKDAKGHLYLQDTRTVVAKGIVATSASASAEGRGVGAQRDALVETGVTDRVCLPIFVSTGGPWAFPSISIIPASPIFSYPRAIVLAKSICVQCSYSIYSFPPSCHHSQIFKFR